MKANIFVVEDESIVALEIKERLNLLGYTVAGSASYGLDAVAGVEESNPDLILMDIKIKGDIDGIQTAEKILESRDIPIIFLTAYADENTLERAKIVTPYGYIIKPFDERELHTNIEIALYKHQAEKLIKEQDEKLKAILKNIGDGVIATDQLGKITYMNSVAEDLLGYNLREIFGANFSEVVKFREELSKKIIPCPIISVISNGKKVLIGQNTELVGKDGKTASIMDSVSPIKDNNNQLTGTVIVFQDLTERRRYEAAIKERDKKYKALVENSPEVISLFSKSKGPLYFSPKINVVTGYSIEELTSNPENVFNLIHKEDSVSLGEEVRELDEGETRLFEFRFKHASGEWIWIQNTITCISVTAEDKIFQGISRNITDEKINREKILMLSRVLESMRNGVLIFDRDLKIIWSNPAMEAMTGYTFDDLLYQNVSILSPVNEEGELHDSIYKEISQGLIWEGEFLNRRKDGSKYTEFITIAPVLNDQQNITHFVEIKQDISDRKMYEEELIEAKNKAERAERMKSEFLAQMSHEIRTPINTIMSFTGLLKEEFQDKAKDELKESFDIINSGGRRLIRTIDLILNISALQSGAYELNIEEIDFIDDIIKPIVGELTVQASEKNLKLEYTNIDVKDTKIKMDRYSGLQIVNNLVNNAIKYTHEGSISVNVSHKSDDTIVMQVSDTGIGMSEDFLPHLFDAFTQETTGYKRKYEGNGLGMALVKRYCEINHITINVKSEQNKGTVFTLEIPVLPPLDN